MNIGVFDSGLGGLWVLKHLQEKLPEYNYIFFGDQANVPYGTKSVEALFACAAKVLDFLYKEKNCGAVLLACNTTSSAIYKELQEWVTKEYPDRKLIGIVEPTLDAMRSSEPVAVFATLRTIGSHVYKHEVNSEIALTELCSRIESGGEILDYLKSFAQEAPAAITTGALCCTHYGIVREDFIKAFPHITRWISQEEILPEFLKNYLESDPEFESKLSKDNNLEICVSKENEVFNTWLNTWYQNPPEIQVVRP